MPNQLGWRYQNSSEDCDDNYVRPLCPKFTTQLHARMRDSTCLGYTHENSDHRHTRTYIRRQMYAQNTYACMQNRCYCRLCSRLLLLHRTHCLLWSATLLIHQPCHLLLPCMHSSRKSPCNQPSPRMHSIWSYCRHITTVPHSDLSQSSQPKTVVVQAGQAPV